MSGAPAASAGGKWLNRLQPAALQEYDPATRDIKLESKATLHLRKCKCLGGVHRSACVITLVLVGALSFVMLSDLTMSLAAASVYSGSTDCWVPNEGLIAGWKPSTTPGRPKLLMGVDVDYPPYAYIRQAPYASAGDLDEVVGVGVDMIRGMAEHCGFDVEIIQVHWSDCWGNGEIGAGLREGWYHGCMTYTHATAVRNRYLDFTDSWAGINKPSGLITRLVNGRPHISGMDDLSGRTIVDVSGWAPTADTLHFVKNQCTGVTYASDFTIVSDADLVLNGSTGYTANGPNDRALIAVLEGQADAMWVYADQASNYQCADGETQEGWDCALWRTLGTEYAYIQTGMFGWMHNGTTVAISKKGSGLNEILDPCLASFARTREFYQVCKTEHEGHNQLSNCVPNEFIQADPDYHPVDVGTEPWMFPTEELAGSQTCATGYCACSEQ